MSILSRETEKIEKIRSHQVIREGVMYTFVMIQCRFIIIPVVLFRFDIITSNNGIVDKCGMTGLAKFT